MTSIERGFTLIELLVVLVLASITAASAGIAVQAVMERAKYSGAIREISALLHSARIASVQEGKPIGVRYDTARRMLTSGRKSTAIPSELFVEYVSLPRLSDGGELIDIFEFNADGYGRGGLFSIFRGQTGVQFDLNIVFGDIRQSAVSRY